MHTLFITKQTRKADVECIILARLGFSAKLISARTGLSQGQIYHRLKIAGFGIKDYREGTSELAQKVITVSSGESQRYFTQVREDLQRLLKEK